MKNHSNLNDILQNIDQLSWEGTLFTNPKQWASSPQSTRFIYLEGDDELEDYNDPQTMLPRLAEENDVKYFLDFQVFNNVIMKQRELNPDSEVDDFILALNHYREYDSFYWPISSKP